MSIPRWIHHVYALLFGYFWLPCPMCGRMFGGHEAGGTLWLTGDEKTRNGKVLCKRHPYSYLDENFDGCATYSDVRL